MPLTYRYSAVLPGEVASDILKAHTCKCLNNWVGTLPWQVPTLSPTSTHYHFFTFYLPPYTEYFKSIGYDNLMLIMQQIHQLFLLN